MTIKPEPTGGRKLSVVSVLAVVLALLALGAAALSVYLWTTNDHTDSLAAGTVMATFAVAATAALAYRQNADLVRAAGAEAKASEDSVTEMRREHELAYRPYLVIRRGYPVGLFDNGPRITTDGGFGWPSESFFVRNVGSGPALNIRLAAQQFVEKQRDWCSEESQGLEPGGEWRAPIRYGHEPRQDGSEPNRLRCIVMDWSDWPGEVIAVRYEDMFGNSYRFGGPNQLRPDEWPAGSPLETQPIWMGCI